MNYLLCTMYYVYFDIYINIYIPYDVMVRYDGKVWRQGDIQANDNDNNK